MEWISSVPRPKQFSFAKPSKDSDEFSRQVPDNGNYHPLGSMQRSLVDSFETLNMLDDFDHSTRSTPFRTPLTEPESLDPLIKTPPSEHHEIFVGRLNSQKVEQEYVHRRFSEYGEILNIQLINKRKTTGIPQDAFAFITYRYYEDACRAIEREHGKAWMGQAIKVAHSIPRPTMASQKNFMFPPFYGYHPASPYGMSASAKNQYEYYAALYSEMNPYAPPYMQHGQKYSGHVPFFPCPPMFPPFGFIPYPTSYHHPNNNNYSHKSEKHRSMGETETK